MTTYLDRELRRLLPFPKVLNEDKGEVKNPMQRVRRRKLGPEQRLPKPLPQPESTEFEYVLKDAHSQRVAFGSTTTRSTRGATRMAITAERESDKNPNIGPAFYDTPTMAAFYPLLNKVTSIYGVGISARRAKRFTDLLERPGPGGSHEPRKSKPAAKPFNIGAKRISLFVDTTGNPGPGYYRLRPEPTRPLWKYHFGAAPREPVPRVMVRCTNGKSLGKCVCCEQGLEIGKEYWYSPSEKQCLCIRCMRAQKREMDKNRSTSRFTFWQLQSFLRARDCSCFHQHEGTTAKIRLITDADVAKLLRRAVYLGRFFNDDGPSEDPDWDKRPAVLDGSSRKPIEPPVVCSSRASTATCLDELSRDRSRSSSLDTEECLERMRAKSIPEETSEEIAEEPDAYFDNARAKMASFKASLRRGRMKRPNDSVSTFKSLSESRASDEEVVAEDREERPLAPSPSDLKEIVREKGGSALSEGSETFADMRELRRSTLGTLKSTGARESEIFKSLTEKKVSIKADLEQESERTIKSYHSTEEQEQLASLENIKLAETEQRSVGHSAGKLRRPSPSKSGEVSVRSGGRSTVALAKVSISKLGEPAARSSHRVTVTLGRPSTSKLGEAAMRSVAPSSHTLGKASETKLRQEEEGLQRSTTNVARSSEENRTVSIRSVPSTMEKTE